MFQLGIIEESLIDRGVLESLKPYLFKQRVEHVPDDPSPIWHINEYRIPEEELRRSLPMLESQMKPTWYAQGFNDQVLIVILQGKSFQIARERDHSWDEMIAYGESVEVERRFLENIPLHV